MIDPVALVALAITAYLTISILTQKTESSDKLNLAEYLEAQA